MFEELESDLCEITGYDKISFQPNRSVVYWLLEMRNMQGLKKNNVIIYVYVYQYVCIYFK